MNYEFTIIIPVYNELGNMQRLEEKISSYLPRSAAAPACALFVDDGSTDGSGSLIEAMCARHDDFFFIRFTRNCGLSAALKAGFDACTSTHAGYIDSDLQTDPDDFDLLLPYAGEFELVTGVRADRKDGFVKKVSSRIANGWRRMMTHDGASDTGCPLKVIQAGCARRLPMFTGMHRFLPALVQMTGGKYKEVPVRHYPRTAGKSKYHLFNRLKGPFIDCFAFRWVKKRFLGYEIEKSKLA